MSEQQHRAPAHDDRWGDNVPWSLRYNVLVDKGNFEGFMRLLAIRLHRLLEHNEANIPNISHFLSRLISESFERFHHISGETYGNWVYKYFDPETIAGKIAERLANDPEEKEVRKHDITSDRKAFTKAIATRDSTRPNRVRAHRRDLIVERLEVLQCLFVLLQHDKKNDALKLLIRDVRRSAAESNILLNIKGDPPTLVPIEEPLLQTEVLDRLLPRLEATYPERAADLIKAYHDLVKGVDTNTVFGNAFKALEELAREISGVSKLELSERPALEKSFPQLHGTIRDTIIKLTAHRGDEGAHGRKGPDEYEIRYLLFCICNVALVLLEYKEHCG